MVQEGGGGSTGLPVEIVMLTHESTERDVRLALEAIARQRRRGQPAAVCLRIQE